MFKCYRRGFGGTRFDSKLVRLDIETEDVEAVENMMDEF